MSDDPPRYREVLSAADPHSRSLAPGPVEDPFFEFTLYICGATGMSQRAVTNAKRLCETHVAGRYTLDVVDLYRFPEQAQRADIFAVPTLIRQRPLPHRRFIGDLQSNARFIDQLTSERFPEQ